MSEHVYSPVLIDEVYDVTYTYNEQEGLKPIHNSRRMLRARSVLAAAFMRAHISHTVIGDYLLYGERRAVQMFELDIFEVGLKFPNLPTSDGTEHIGYYALPDDEQSGWRLYPGWAITFLNDKTPEHRMFDMYHSVRHSITYLSRNPDVYGNILSARLGKSL